jgi:hypothetical protein
MQAARVCLRSGAPKSQGRAARKERVEIEQVEAQMTRHRIASDAAVKTLICADGLHVP